MVNTELEAKSLHSYLKYCKLPNYLLSLLKGTQHISKKNCEIIPLVPLDRIWDNKTVYEYFGLSQDEIDKINNHPVFGYKCPVDSKKIELSFNLATATSSTDLIFDSLPMKKPTPVVIKKPTSIVVIN